MTGEDAYDVYVARHRAAHPDCEPMSRGEYWRDRMDERDANPTMRCC